MQESRKRVFETVLPRAEIGQALARLTAGADQGRLVIAGETIPFDDVASLKVSLKPHGDAWRLLVRLKDAGPIESADAPVSGTAESGRPRYKDLKKRMKRTFAALEAAAAAGTSPSADVLASFVADSRLMTTYSGKGDPDYPAYDAAVTQLEAVCAAGDPARLAEAVATLRRLKKECHNRYA